jgi:hypothetical protein
MTLVGITLAFSYQLLALSYQPEQNHQIVNPATVSQIALADS